MMVYSQKPPPNITLISTETPRPRKVFTSHSSVQGDSEHGAGQVTQQETEKIKPPSKLGEWGIKQIEQALARKIPAHLLKTLPDIGVKYIPWYECTRILNKYSIGWEWEITDTQLSSDRIFITGRLTIPTADGRISRCATGTSELKRTNKEGESVEIAFGDPSSNAEAQAFKRACARFSLGLYLYSQNK